ncbi:bacteriorhodopsin [Acuticoccus sp. I52.16.1]|uniref:bacteriorhodopsin n=1 Tax=Acuticoccus sp. I52.16.1 TaxID=2928472 RepID=UPI001FD07842|nr:bacteriorhodopsin [Acuticoccus sp. I52.16.1]UOM35872.1 microbial rhodopsin family protein [Acuticoccus sp. I52.16.1]
MSTTIDWIAAACLGLGAAAILALGGFQTRRQATRTGLHALVCAIAAILYVVLATGGRFLALGPLEIETHHLVWLLATPLLLAALMVTAAPVGHTLLPMALTVLFVDAVMVLARAVAAVQYGGAVWIWFLVSLAAMGLLYALLWRPIREAAHAGHPVRADLYERHATVLMALWGLWPVIFFLGPDFQGVIGHPWQQALYGVVDVAAFAGFGLLVVLEDERLIPVEDEEDEATLHPTLLRPARPAPVLHTTPATGRALARERLLENFYRGGEAARLAAVRGRTGSKRALEAAGPMVSRAMGAREPAPPTELPLRRRKPGLVTSLRVGVTTTPFGQLTRDDAVPVALVAGTLFVIANASKIAGKRR